MYHKRRYKPIFPEKYEGDPTNIVMRSSWETRFALWCDRNPAVVKWSSEETIIPYRCQTDNKLHRYFVDFRIKVKQTDGSLKTYIIEIKPDAQTRPPEFPGRKTKKFMTEAFTFVKNQSKWKAAEQWCLDRGYEFKILTERELGI
jgi:hypothetical protein